MINPETQLLRVAKSHPNSAARRNALVQLRDMRSDKLRPILLEIIHKETKNQNLRETAIKALGDVGLEADLELLRQIADGETREFALFAKSAAQKAYARLASHLSKPIGPGRTRTRTGIPSSTRYAVFQRDSHRCVNCGRSSHDGVILHVDHIMPASLGGTNRIENLQTLCEECNAGKSNRDTRDLRKAPS
jgi:hypothetical protein